MVLITLQPGPLTSVQYLIPEVYQPPKWTSLLRYTGGSTGSYTCRSPQGVFWDRPKKRPPCATGNTGSTETTSLLSTSFKVPKRLHSGGAKHILRGAVFLTQLFERM